MSDERHVDFASELRINASDLRIKHDGTSKTARQIHTRIRLVLEFFKIVTLAKFEK